MLLHAIIWLSEEARPRRDAGRRLTCWHANKPKAFPPDARCPLAACGFAQTYPSNTLSTQCPSDFLSVSVVDSGCAGNIIRSDGRAGVNMRQKDERPRLSKHVAMRDRIKRDVSWKLVTLLPCWWISPSHKNRDRAFSQNCVVQNVASLSRYFFGNNFFRRFEIDFHLAARRKL